MTSGRFSARRGKRPAVESSVIGELRRARPCCGRRASGGADMRPHVCGAGVRPLNSVCSLELATMTWLAGCHRFLDRRREHIDPDERRVAAWLGRLLDHPDDAPFRVEFGDSELLWVV